MTTKLGGCVGGEVSGEVDGSAKPIGRGVVGVTGTVCGSAGVATPTS